MSANLLKRTPFPSMTGLPARGPMLPRPRDRGAVADDGDEVPLGGVPEDLGRVPGDPAARLGDSRRVGERQVPLRPAGLGRHDLDLSRAAALVIPEGIVLDRHLGLLRHRRYRRSARSSRGAPERHSAHDAVVGGLERERDRTRLARADRPSVDPGDGGDLRRRAAEEHFVRHVQLGPVDGTLLDRPRCPARPRG